MNKQGIRAFSLGMIVAICLLGTYYYYFAQENLKIVDAQSAKSLLQKSGFIVLSSDEYKKLQTAQSNKNEKSSTNQTKNNNFNKNQSTTVTYHLKVAPGMNLSEIASLLVQEKIIDNNVEFTQYLTVHHDDSKIQLGSYTLTNKMDYEQIAKIITKAK